ncbi:Fumarate reductase flavoprotein subunit (Fe(3+)-induced flavocytochrome C3) (Ifc3) (Iron(III)-induced flavocytochrome C3) [Durusdinium trenchii]|uniref:Fumarate reductase flavoprotein subunit (Fe(3+)-induced flavocytochrome C3) (Ifc3) (Iron(III)-induced flavocytochrome C3) n=1 Tax=Durusdinium trenchii TaxID=1381693 RepID=A0ABP0KVD3_9DINO
MTRKNLAGTKSELSRRAVLGAGAASALALPIAADAMPRPMPETWDETVDVVVVGSGFAGLAAAYEAQKAGASVAILEKMRTPGGNSLISGGVMSAAGSPAQAAQGIEDSPEQLYQDMLTAGLHLNHPELARIAAERSTETHQWTVDEFGAEWADELSHMGGHAVPRAYKTAVGSGAGVVVPMLETLRDLGIEPRTGALLKHIVRDDDGRVKGVEIREGYRFPDEDSGTTKLIRASRGVVLATGGFGNDIGFRMLQDPRLDETLDSTNQPGATGEALREDNKVIAFCDGKGFEVAQQRLGDDLLAALLDSGVVRKFDTLDAMAAAYDSPLDPLAETISAFNGSVDVGEDQEMGRYMQADQFRIETPPYYAVRLLPKIHHCMGGLAMDAEARALDVQTSDPIPGLYVAGEAAGGVHGASRLGSCAYVDCLVFGRIAGKNVAVHPAWG